jgi:hypothetical protein
VYQSESFLKLLGYLFYNSGKFLAVCFSWTFFLDLAGSWYGYLHAHFHSPFCHTSDGSNGLMFCALGYVFAKDQTHTSLAEVTVVCLGNHGMA